MNNRTSSKPETSLLSVPSEFICPLSHKIMTDPVYLSGENYSYERKALLAYFKECANHVSRHDKEKRADQSQRYNPYAKNAASLWNEAWNEDFVIKSPVSGEELVRYVRMGSGGKVPESAYPEVFSNGELKARIDEYLRLKPLIENLSEKLQTVEKTNQKLIDQNKQLEAKSEDLEDQKEMLERSVKNVDLKNKDLGVLTAELREMNVALNARNIALIAENKKSYDRTRILKAKSKKLGKENDVLLTKMEELMGNNSELEDQNQAAIVVNEALKAEVEALSIVNTELKEQNDVLKAKNQELAKLVYPETSRSVVSLMRKRTDSPISHIIIKSAGADKITPTSTQEDDVMTSALNNGP